MNPTTGHDDLRELLARITAAGAAVARSAA